ncbi:GFA family protein [Halieaceae bacterium IMCC14734]|uniref:GFA family protein n=1 Tax=Candidatus Litorirhabdus singularis TaxID=2518993 RepID=A0ABT3TCT1_9GAMM|nr:GFA family protein [Candidatus Litorirhabdus singularis]MCX2980112.1 GFA family protein [Candidatus Litorirhabdus singularis]
MTTTGGCYCGQLRYEAEGEPGFRAQCHCRECQYISGGSPNVIMGFPDTGFSYTKGQPKVFARDDIEGPARREFCGDCGTHILTRAASVNDMVIVKVGTLDDPSLFGKADFAIQVADKQSFHHLPEDVPAFDRWMG